MKKKTVVLLALVMGIWGAIGYQIYQHLSEQEPVIEYRRKSKTIVAVDSLELYELHLKYQDPFLKKITAKQNVPIQKNVVVQKRVDVPKQQATVVAWGVIEYLGSIYNTTRQSLVAMVRINGVDYTSRQGQMINGFQILEIRKDSVEVMNGNQKKYIKRKK
jgi:hypothetical protein